MVPPSGAHVQGEFIPGGVSHFEFHSLLFLSRSVDSYVLPEGVTLILPRHLDSHPNNTALNPPECQAFPVP